jgi:hypothetical protein
LQANIFHPTKKILCRTVTPLEELFRLSKFKRSGSKYIEMSMVFEINRAGTKVYVNLEVKKKRRLFGSILEGPSWGLGLLKNNKKKKVEVTDVSHTG